MTVLHIDSSARHENSVTRDLTSRIVDLFDASIIRRDLSSPLPLLTEDWVGANFTPKDDRNQDQVAVLKLSDQLVEELEAADTIVIGAPIYNFGVPAALKAWIDLVARAGRTFKYGDNGPVGLLKNKKAIVVIASGGTVAGSEIDFATPYLKHVLGFIGIHDVTVIAADQLGAEADAKIKSAVTKIESLAA